MIDRDYITETCDSLPMVTWDRCILMDDEDHAVVYGWIPAPHQRLVKEQEVGRHDFVVIQFWFGGWGSSDGSDHRHNFITSSARHSAKISEILLPGVEHSPCQTVQDMLPDLKKKVGSRITEDK